MREGIQDARELIRTLEYLNADTPRVAEVAYSVASKSTAHEHRGFPLRVAPMRMTDTRAKNDGVTRLISGA